MTYNFDEIIPRRNTNSYKWDSAADPDTLPMWVADMDFQTAPSIVAALQKRVAHGIFGYTRVPQAYYDATMSWFENRHNWQIKQEWIIYTTGVVPALSAIIKAIAAPGDRILVQPPVYNCFFSSICNNGCEIVSNPHNPAGRVWTRQELIRIGDICLRNKVWVVADEIHCELTYPGHDYTPFASISEEFLMHSVTCTSPSKAFNLAGLQIANIFCADADIRRKVDKAINVNEVCDVNPFGIEALIAAYNEGAEWLDELRHYLQGNYNFLKAYFNEHLPQFPILPLEGTYLAWIDCSVLQLPSQEIEKRLLEKQKLWVNAGEMYGDTGNNFIRINLACPRQALLDGLERLNKGILK